MVTLLVTIALVLDMCWPYARAWAAHLDEAQAEEAAGLTQVATGADEAEADGQTGSRDDSAGAQAQSAGDEGARQESSEAAGSQSPAASDQGSSSSRVQVGPTNDSQTPAQQVVSSFDATEGELTTLSCETDAVNVEVTLSEDARFCEGGHDVAEDELSLQVVTGDEKPFAQLCDEPGVQLQTVEVLLCDKYGTEVEQVDGTLELSLKVELPEVDSDAKIGEVEVYQLSDDAERAEDRIEQVSDQLVAQDEELVSVEGDTVGTYALRYTVDYEYNGEAYHMPGGSRMLLSELFKALGIKQDAADVETIDFTNPSVLTFERYEDKCDWVIQSNGAFTTQETLTCVFENGYRLVIGVTDAQAEYSESSNLEDFIIDWKIAVGDTVFSNDSVDDDTVIEYKEGMQYSLELNFAERPELGFAAPETNPPTMTFLLPDCFLPPLEAQLPLNVNLGRKGVLPDNLISFREVGSGDDTHIYLDLTWNWQDTLHWNFFRDSSQAKLKIVINGVFQETSPNVLSINGKDVAIRKQDLHNAIVNKEGVYNRDTGIITYTVTVSSDGTTSDITLTDTPGSALSYQGDIVYDALSSINNAGTTPQITAQTGNTFSVVIPEMVDKDCLVFRYSASVDYDRIAVSGNPTFEETGNTAQIFGDSYTLDNTAMYHETNIDFSDLEKNVVSKRQETIDGKFSYILSWEIETNKRAQYPLAGTTITDTISPTIESFSKYYGDGLTIKCYDAGGALEETRHVSWQDLGVDLANDTSWTYHIPDLDPLYRYVLTYDTVVDMSAQTETVVAENTAEGKGGIDSDRAVLTLPGVAGISVSKKATNVGSSTVTWEVNLTVSGASLNSQRLVLAEHSGTKTVNNQTTWYSDYMPGKWFDVTSGDTNYYGWFKETLQKVEVIGLEGDETYAVTYGYTSGGTLTTREFVFDTPGQSVMEQNFASAASKWQADYFRLEFYKDFERTQGGLNSPGGENPSRTLTIRLTNTFPEEWAAAARATMLSTSKMESSIFAHINWIDVQTPDSSGNLTSRAFDTDKIEPMPPTLFKTVIEYTDTTVASASQKAKWPLNFPNVIYNSNYNNLTYTDAAYGDLPVFPAFRYQVLVAGIKYDEPLVIEDTFDTSKFALLTRENLGGGGGGIITCKSKYYTQNLVMRVAGTRYFGAFAANNNNYYRLDPNGITYSFGIKNTGYTDRAEDHGCQLELTDTGFRVTINKLFRDNDGNLFPNYGVEYWLVPKNLEALKEIEEMARANGKAGLEPKASFTNTASCRGLTASATVKYGITNDFMPIDKSSETYINLMDGTQQKLKEEEKDGQTVRELPSGVQAENVKSYVMKYRVVLNKGRERLNEGNDIIAEDEYSPNLSVDFHSIKITTEPAEAASKVSYDYSGNIGYFTIPDETKVTIEYEAVILQTAAGLVHTSNEVRMLQYKKTVEDHVDHGGAGGSTAPNPSILIKKYGSGHMEKGLNGAQFQLYEYKHQTYTKGDPNTAADWEPVVLTDPDAEPGTEPATHYAVYTTGNLTVGDTEYGDGYAEIELSQQRDGMTLQTKKVYGLREITTPTATATNGDTINYQNPHSDSFYCYIFSICGEDETANYSNYVFLQDDTMTVRNMPESISLHMSKEMSGNCEPSVAEKSGLTYQVFRKNIPTGSTEAIYMPIMTTVTDPDTHADTQVVDPRFVNIRYDQLAIGKELTGLTVESGTTVGEYLIVEYGNDTIMSSHPDWSWRGSYEWADGSVGSFTNASYTVYDENAENPQTVTGIAFTVTSQEIKDAENKSVVLTNTYTQQTVSLIATKKWASPSGSAIAWPPGKQVKFELGRLDDDGTFVANPLVATVTLDNQQDANGEDAAGSAYFKNLPKYDVDNGQLKPIRYAVRENPSVSNYNIVYPEGNLGYAEFATSTSVSIKNQAEATSISVSKAWDRNTIPSGATATFRLYAYTGSDPAEATWVNNVNDIVLNGTVDTGEETFGEGAAWRADFTGLPIYDSSGQMLTYIAKEVACTPKSYEPVEEYAANGRSITNKPASTTFTVTKKWQGTPGNAWPAGEQVVVELKRRTQAAGIDNDFSVEYVLAQDSVVSQGNITDPYGVPRQTGSCSGGVLTVTDLQKYDSNGNEWLYYATEVDVQNSVGESALGNYSVVYRDKYGNTLATAGGAYSGGSISNTASTKALTIAKAVTGNMGDRTKEFRFTVTLTSSGGTPYSKPVVALINGAAEDGSEINFVNGIATIRLKHNESLTLTNLPGGLMYTVAEDATDAGGYDTSWTVTDDAGSTLESSSPGESSRTATRTLQENQTITFTNDRGTLIPQGVYDNGLLYLLVALSALAVAVFVSRRHAGRNRMMLVGSRRQRGT